MHEDLDQLTRYASVVESWNDAIESPDLSPNSIDPDPFAEACGLSGPLQVHLEGPGAEDRTTIELRQPFLIVGRDPIADLNIDDPEVSPRHAYLQVIAGRVFALNIGSRSGVHWDEGPRLASWVDSGNGIRIGPTRIKFGDLEVGQGGSLPITEDFEWPSPTEARLEFLGDESSRKPWQITRALSLLGSSPTCRVHLPGPGIGRMHAALVRTPTGIWIVDLLGPGGVSVRGTPTRYAMLNDGDEIGIGPHRMRFMIGPVEQPAENFKLAKRQPDRLIQPTRSSATNLKPSVSVDREVTTSSDQPLSISLDSATTTRLLEEFDRMHQRTVDQFQQAMMMMFRMHQDQMDSVRDELSRLDRLEAELKTLKTEAAGDNTARSESRPPSAGSAQSRVRNDEDVEFGPEPTGRKTAAAPVSDPWAANLTAPPRTGPKTSATASTGFDSNPDPHARLTQRIAEIQAERQGLWKRIMASLSGDTSVKRIP